MLNARRLRHCVIVLSLVIGSANSTLAETRYPTGTIKIVVPVPPGPTADVLPRLIAGKLAAAWDQSVIIENRPGAALNLAAGAVFKAPPDGHTLLATPAPPLVINEFLYAKLPYDPVAFAPVAILGETSNVLVARPNAPFATFPEFVAYAKSHPGRLTYASSGIGSTSHLAMEALKSLAGIEATHVPYNALGPALRDVLAGHVDLLFDTLGNVAGPIRDGQVTPLALGHPGRLEFPPDVPAIAEFYPGFVSTTWFALVAPPGTPRDAVEKLSTAIGAALRERDIVEQLRGLFVTPVDAGPDEAARFMATERARWRQIISAANIKVDQ
jgi:tripartite-type tricarboxylate transporter receptor subunit TctC